MWITADENKFKRLYQWLSSLYRQPRPKTFVKKKSHFLKGTTYNLQQHAKRKKGHQNGHKAFHHGRWLRIPDPYASVTGSHAHIVVAVSRIAFYVVWRVPAASGWCHHIKCVSRIPPWILLVHQRFFKLKLLLSKCNWLWTVKPRSGKEWRSKIWDIVLQ
jgi:hypothetical protein